MFGVTERMAELPSNIAINCQRSAREMQVKGLGCGYMLNSFKPCNLYTRINKPNLAPPATRIVIITLFYRCSDVHRQMVLSGAYLEVTLQKGEEKVYICCPRSLQSELRRCISNGKQQGYNMLSSPDESAGGFQDS